MPKLNRQKQHRPSRDTAKSKELADLRRENHRLKKAVAQGRKTVQRVVDSNDMFRGIDRSTALPMPEMKGCVLTREVFQDAIDRTNALPKDPPIHVVPPGICYSCGCATKTLELGPKVAEVCPECGWRRVVKPGPI